MSSHEATLFPRVDTHADGMASEYVITKTVMLTENVGWYTIETIETDKSNTFNESALQ